MVSPSLSFRHSIGKSLPERVGTYYNKPDVGCMHFTTSDESFARMKPDQRVPLSNILQKNKISVNMNSVCSLRMIDVCIRPWSFPNMPTSTALWRNPLSMRLNSNACDHSLVHQEAPWVRSLHHLPGKEGERAGQNVEQTVKNNRGESEDVCECVCVCVCYRKREIMRRHKEKAGEEGIRLHQLILVMRAEKEIRHR